VKRKDRKKARARAKRKQQQDPTWADYAAQIEDEPDFLYSRFIGLRRMAEQEMLLQALTCPDCREEWGLLTRRRLKSGWLLCDVCGDSIHLDRIEVKDETGRTTTLGVLLRSSLSDRAEFAKYQYYLARIDNDGKPLI